MLRKDNPVISIGKKKVGVGNPTYVIAEVGLNHQGDVKLAKKLIDIAVDAGCDCVKFQKRSLKNVYKKDVLANVNNEEQGTQYILKKLISCELSNSEMKSLYLYSTKKNIDFSCSPWDEESLKFLAREIDLPVYKIGSPDMCNFKLIREVVKQNKPIIISTGMSFVSEIDQLVEFLDQVGAKYALLHCNSTYPVAYSDVNLRFLGEMKKKYHCPIGYSGHEKGITTCLGAVALGASIIEKHITLDRKMDGPDHRASLEPDEMKHLVREIRILEESLGEPVKYVTRGEYLNRENFSKSLVAAKDLKKGKILKDSDITLKSPGKGTNPLKFNLFVGQKLIARDVYKDDYLLESDIGDYSVTSDDIRLNHKWGVVARMSDIDALLSKNHPDFVEIHLTDTDVNMGKVYKKKYDIDLVVHGPEYNGDLLLDLSNPNESIRKDSIEFFNKSLSYARKLKKLFKNHASPVKFVVHPGSFEIDLPKKDEKKQRNKNFLDSLSKLKCDGFEPLVENMPAWAWFFGGQWYSQSFMDSKEIADFSKKTGYGVVFDTSHAALYCNYSKKDLLQYARNILPMTKYIHISDAAKYNGEGLQIGDGTIDFKNLMKILVKTDNWFLPEIWQGHKFGGEGFVKAIKKLKNINNDF